MVDVAHPEPAELAAFASGGLEPARHASVEAHLRACARCSAALVTPAAAAEGTRRVSGNWRATGEATAQTQPDAGEPSDMPELGAIVAGKYRVEGVVGRGGMGVVLSARHVELGHRVALKVLRSAHSQDVQRFLREAQTCVQLRGEHVVRVFDLGRLPAGSPFFVMELLEGEDLASALKRGPVPVSAAIRCIIEACAGLAEAHAAGVVHRDLKPANLFLEARVDAEPRIKVLDFGISKWLPQHPANRGGAVATMTSGDVVMGSMLYMSPEQLRTSRDVDARTDVWSLGVILYELLCGEPPFTAESPSAVAIRIATGAAEPITSRLETVPKQLEKIIARCLEKDREARYPNVSALAADLRLLVASGDLHGLPTERPAPHRPHLTALAIAALIAICAALAVWFPSRAKDSTTTHNAAAHDAAAARSEVGAPPRGEGAAAERGEVSAASRGENAAAVRGESAAAARGEEGAAARGEVSAAVRGESAAAARGKEGAAVRGESAAAARGEEGAAARGASSSAAPVSAAGGGEVSAAAGGESAAPRRGAGAVTGVEGAGSTSARAQPRRSSPAQPAQPPSAAGERKATRRGAHEQRRSKPDLDIGEILPP